MTRTAQTTLTAIALLAAMAATRSHHFTSLLGPGDATLAVFFLGGLFLRRAGWLGFFLAMAGMIDFLAVQTGTSAWCITPGYALLAPAYGALWLAGRLSTGMLQSQRGLLSGAGLLAGGVVVFFVISNVAFYAFADALADMNAIDFALGVAVYLPGYLAQAFLYSGAGLAVAHVLTRTGRPATAA
ncbi:hypothetical protein [Immundisolibacter sp.]